VDRDDAADRRKVVHPEEKITRKDALKKHTIWPAYIQFAEKERGSIQASKLRLVIDHRYLN
jgi:predicted amidohydrolase YtcJ